MCSIESQYEEQRIKTDKGELNLNLNREPTARKLAELSNREVVGNQAETVVDSKEGHIFNGLLPQGLRRTDNTDHPYGNMNNKFAGNWTVVSPSGSIKNIGNIVLNPNGTYTTTDKGVQPSNSSNEKKPAPPAIAN